MTSLLKPTNPAPAPPEPLAVDAKALARLLCCSVRHIERMDVAGKLPVSLRLGCRAKRWVLDGPNGIREWLRLGCPDRVQFKAMQAE